MTASPLLAIVLTPLVLANALGREPCEAHPGSTSASVTAVDPDDRDRTPDAHAALELGSWVSDSFPVPSQLAPSVIFWRELFVTYESTQALLHDREDPQVVWGVLELPTNEQGKLDEARGQRLMRAELKELKRRLKRLEKTGVAADSRDETLLALSRRADADVLAGAWHRARVQRGVADHFRAGVERAQTWLPTIKEILAAEGVPVELIALIFVESMFNPKARSSAGAGGLWQLMPATAKGLGLTVRRGKDERYDIAKATRAAARMLRRSHKILGSWPLALTAYNHGPNGVRRAVRKVGSSDLMVLIEQYDKSTWGFASKNFYAEFLAALEILSAHPDVSRQLALNADAQRSEKLQ